MAHMYQVRRKRGSPSGSHAAPQSPHSDVLPPPRLGLGRARDPTWSERPEPDPDPDPDPAAGPSGRNPPPPPPPKLLYKRTQRHPSPSSPPPPSPKRQNP